MSGAGEPQTKEQMRARLRELARTSPIVSRALTLGDMGRADPEEVALTIAVAAVSLLDATQRELLDAYARRQPWPAP